MKHALLFIWAFFAFIMTGYHIQASTWRRGHTLKALTWFATGFISIVWLWFELEMTYGQ